MRRAKGFLTTHDKQVIEDEKQNLLREAREIDINVDLLTGDKKQDARVQEKSQRMAKLRHSLVEHTREEFVNINKIGGLGGGSNAVDQSAGAARRMGVLSSMGKLN